MKTVCNGTPLRAYRGGAGEAEINFGGVGCLKLPLLGRVSFAPSVMADGLVGVSMISSSDTLKFFGIPRMDMTRGFYISRELFRMTSATGIPIGPVVPTVGYTTDIPLNGAPKSFVLSLGLRVPF